MMTFFSYAASTIAALFLLFVFTVAVAVAWREMVSTPVQILDCEVER